MKVAINIRNVVAVNKSGVDVYVEQLAKFVPERDENNMYYLFVDKRATKNLVKLLERANVKVIKIPFVSDRYYQRLLTYYCTMVGVDIIHFPVGGIPKKLKTPYIVSVLDLTFEMYPEFYTADDLKKQKSTKAIAQNALGIIAISESTKQDLIKFYKIKPDKIKVTHLALKDMHKTFIKKQNKSKPFLLFVGNIQPRKNLVNGIKALKYIPDEKRPNLYIVGASQDHKELRKIQEIIKRSKLSDYVKIFGYLKESELNALYQTCESLFYPSIYEGFGYNILEAFYMRKPIILSANSSLPEVAGKAGIYVDPSSPESIARGIETVLFDKNEVKRKVEIGAKRLKLFTPQAMADNTISAYKYFLSRVSSER